MKILDWLSRVDYEKDHQGAKNDRLEGTCGWLFEKQAFLEWRASSASGILWLHGDRKINNAYSNAVVTNLTLLLCFQVARERRDSREYPETLKLTP